MNSDKAPPKRGPQIPPITRAVCAAPKVTPISDDWTLTEIIAIAAATKPLANPWKALAARR